MSDPWRTVPTLSGKYVTLSPMMRADRDGIVSALADPGPESFTTTVPNDDSIDAWLTKLDTEFDAGRALPFTVRDTDGAICGVTRFLRLAPQHRRLEIGGTVYGKRVRRTGLNSETKLLLLTHAFEEMGVNCVQFRTDFLNRRSRAAIERLGARQDGVIRGHLIINGHYRDSVLYSVLAYEWAGVKLNIKALLDRHEEDER